VQENFENLGTLCELANLYALQDFTIAADLKVGNLIFGLMSHASTHPCCWCDVHRDWLHDRGTDRTIGSLQQCFEHFQANGAIRSSAKNSKNVVHRPLFHQLDATKKVLDLFPPPELHLLTGPVNFLLQNLHSAWPECDTWIQQCHVSREAQHGGTFTGNSCRILLRSVDSMAALGPVSCLPYVVALRSLSAVVSSCYGEQLDADFLDAIQRFRVAYLDLGISITPKVHAVLHHVADFCSARGRGLGLWTEQAVEAAHHDFRSLWKNFQVRDSSHPAYEKQLLRAVQVYNSQHL
jgi:hypothetical protein